MKSTTSGKCYQRLVFDSLLRIFLILVSDDQQEQGLSKSIVNRIASGIEVPEGLASQSWINYFKYAVNAYANSWETCHPSVAASKLTQHLRLTVGPNFIASFTLHHFTHSMGRAKKVILNQKMHLHESCVHSPG
jgi:hypothetical protein